MNRTQRLLIYGIVGIPIPIISGILYGFNWEVYSFMLLVLVAAVVYETVTYFQKK